MIKMTCTIRGHREGGHIGSLKNFKTPFFGDVESSFHEVTDIGLEPHQFFFLFKISLQIWLLEASKVLDKMGYGWQAK